MPIVPVGSWGCWGTPDLLNKGDASYTAKNTIILNIGGRFRVKRDNYEDAQQSSLSCEKKAVSAGGVLLVD